MTQYAIVQNPDQSTQSRSYQYYPQSAPVFPALPPPPPDPLTGLIGLLRLGSVVVGAFSLGTIAFGSNEQADKAVPWATISSLILSATSPAPVSPSPSPAPVFHVKPVMSPTKPANPVTREEVEDIKIILGKVCRQQALTDAEVTMLRVALFGDDDAD